MSENRGGGRPRARAAAALGVLAVVIAGCASSPVRDVPGPSGGGAADAPSGQVADPSRVRIPSIGVDAAVGALGLEPSGALEAPTDFDATGWYEAGPEPGEPGPAVIAGHVDDYTGPAVFYRLRDLRAGEEVIVDRVDGSSATFVVTRVEKYPKDGFPTAEVYGTTPGPELRLITCGGDFDTGSKSYLSNEVVYATEA